MENNKLFGVFDFAKRSISFNEISSIWFRRPVTPIIENSVASKENQIFATDECRALLDGIWSTLNCFWISKPTSIYRAENKLFQLKIASEAGFSIWPTLITNSPKSLNAFYQNQKNIIYKPIRRGRIERSTYTGLIFTNKITSDHEILFDNIKLAPGIFQKHIPKNVEIRVTVIGQKVFAVEIHSQENPTTLIDWRRIDSRSLFHKIHFLPSNVEQLCRNLVQKLDLQFGAIDLILTPSGEYIFLEINPNGQWAWIQQLCEELPLRETLVDLLLSKME
ncbi:MAG: hypothetical protein GX638_14590 [Crenarchaeota archaeon]|nr:hypothetical protein [Thermoproteota archaeon]